jgi:hypothetical protein
MTYFTAKGPCRQFFPVSLTGPRERCIPGNEIGDSMRPLVFFLLFVSFPCFAAPLSVIPVGDFGGYRVKAPCFFGPAARLCTLDTMGSVSVIPADADFARYAVSGHETVNGIGTELDCDVVDVNDLDLLGARPQHLFPLRCASDNPGFPLVGLPFFDGRVFTFDFPQAQFLWDQAATKPKPLLRIGGSKLWIAMEGTFAGEKLVVAFDTGNPVTIVTRAFVDAHPASFQPSLKPISPGLLAKGLLPFDVLTPIVVGGVELRAESVYAGSAFPALFFEEAAIILGMNHAVSARWWFDLGRGYFDVAK